MPNRVFAGPRWPMPTGGFTPTPSSPGSSSQMSQWRPAAASSAIVVHRCPDGATHWRSSVQIRQDSGGASVPG